MRIEIHSFFVKSGNRDRRSEVLCSESLSGESKIISIRVSKQSSAQLKGIEAETNASWQILELSWRRQEFGEETQPRADPFAPVSGAS